MPFTTNLSGTAQIDDSLLQEYDQQFIVAAAEMGVMDQFVTYKREIGAKSIEFPKYDQLALATTALTETDDVTSEAVSDTLIKFTPAEYGKAVTTTRLASLQSGGKIDIASARLVGMNMGRTRDKLAVLAAEASTNELTPDGSAESALTSADTMTGAFLNKLYNKLARSSVMPLAEGMYVAIMHDDVIHDLRAESGAGSWQDVSKYRDQIPVLRNEVGTYKGFRIVEDSLITINADAGDTNTDTYHSICMGFNALGYAVSQEPGLVLTGPFDKLNRFVNVGWYGVFKYDIVDQDALWIGTSASSVGANA